MSKWVIFFKWQLLFWVTVLHYTYQDTQEPRVFKLSCLSSFPPHDQLGQSYHSWRWATPLLFPRSHIPGRTCHPAGRNWLVFYEKLFQAKKGTAQIADCIPRVPALERGENRTGVLWASATACRAKTGKFKDTVSVMTPMEDRLGGQKLVNTRNQVDVPT